MKTQFFFPRTMMKKGEPDAKNFDEQNDTYESNANENGEREKGEERKKRGSS